ncbi:MAG: 4-hydroxy-tetrahydrodipicolinate synthase [Alphaproteobacteria bacterium]|nr:4-hydroxy-tetrahydrodipicolinate synthase [Alphaproteobacteria bacterium]MBU1512885.1 4-hydroxy-tetrahydrodipicolinate synthase [Alphaproteobacteria bacterium]MBU2096674.1 4-hydroxy-tetrahydrodipicolinate synthase [Alphaproteobacteria bacterium]MBU2150557.1 4-hydroxy-tetrahydrodipicolinate synthase [Alphaproteobacteria bacterium]MBU2308055.1 4-hydroxy-tetrahydrodipicolinate synthase [Alphaproteobacteria bacterium]
MSEPLFRGVLPALVTPFRNGAVDEDAFVSLVERQIAAGVHGLVPVGTTGETATLSHAEHRRVVELCVQTARGRVPVIAGAGSNSTAEAIELVQHAKAVGADAALVVTPYYNRPNQEGLYAHYAAINDAVQLPVLVYNVPARTSVDISNAVLVRLSKLPNIVGIKDATGDLGRASLQRVECGEDWVLLSGNDDQGLGYVAQGGHGCISVTCNVAPELVAQMYNDALSGQWQGALYGQDRLIRLHKALFSDASPSPAKFAMAQLGLCTDEVRLPIVPCSEAARAEVLVGMRDAGLI